MTKFSKRLGKIGKKDLNTAIAVGSDFSSLENLLNVFSTVFLISQTDPGIKIKNLIRVRDLDYAASLYNIDMIFINKGANLDILKFLGPLLKKTHPIIMIDETYNSNIELKEFIFSLRYEMIENNLGYQVWKEIRR